MTISDTLLKTGANTLVHFHGRRIYFGLVALTARVVELEKDDERWTVDQTDATWVRVFIMRDLVKDLTISKGESFTETENDTALGVVNTYRIADIVDNPSRHEVEYLCRAS